MTWYFLGMFSPAKLHDISASLEHCTI